jgi:hypothetical protein
VVSFTHLPLYPRERALGTHSIGGSVGSRAVLDAASKRKIPSLRRKSNPRIPIVQPVAQEELKAKERLFGPRPRCDDNVKMDVR